MKVTITYVKKKYSFKNWVWYFRAYKHVKGFSLRIFGIHINIRENNAHNKLIKKWNTERNLK